MTRACLAAAGVLDHLIEDTRHARGECTRHLSGASLSELPLGAIRRLGSVDREMRRHVDRYVSLLAESGEGEVTVLRGAGSLRLLEVTLRHIEGHFEMKSDREGGIALALVVETIRIDLQPAERMRRTLLGVLATIFQPLASQPVDWERVSSLAHMAFRLLHAAVRVP
jgi:hypothetical protein